MSKRKSCFDKIKFFFNKYKVLCLLGIFFLVCSILSYLGPIAGDPCWSVFAGKYIAENDKIPFDEPLGRDGFFWPPFLFHLIVAFFYKIEMLININFIFLIIPLASSGTLVFTYLLAKKDFNKKIALMASLFLASTPIFFDYSSNYYMGVLLTFFVVGSVYFAKNDNFWLSGFFFGLAIFTKFNGFFILPLLVYILYKHKKFQISPYLKFFSLCLIGLIPYIRNYIIFKNPVWPFINSIFHGMSLGVLPELQGINVNFNPIPIIKGMFLAFLGVPHGFLNSSLMILNSFLGFDISSIAIFLFFLESIIIFPLIIYGFFRDTKKKAVYFIWILGFIPFQLGYISNYGMGFLRYFLPFFPAIAIFFAIGTEKLVSRWKKYDKIIYSLILLIFLVFILTICLKRVVALDGWSHFEDDYRFIKENTSRDTLFYYNGQCLNIHTNRFSTQFREVKTIRENSIVFLNNNFFMEPSVSFDDSEQNRIIQSTNCTIIYNNNFTGTKLCFINKKRQGAD